MSSDYYGAIAGEQADRGAADEAAFLAWENEWARREDAKGTAHDELRAAFLAGLNGERRRIRREIKPARLEALARWFDDDDRFKERMFPEAWPPGTRPHDTQDDLRRWARLLRGENEDTRQAGH